MLAHQNVDDLWPQFTAYADDIWQAWLREHPEYSNAQMANRFLQFTEPSSG